MISAESGPDETSIIAESIHYAPPRWEIRMETGYDIIGDVHGHAAALENLLEKVMGYSKRDVIENPLTCTARPRRAAGRRNPCRRPFRVTVLVIEIEPPAGEPSIPGPPAPSKEAS
jgi:hypothetical protein